MKKYLLTFCAACTFLTTPATAAKPDQSLTTNGETGVYLSLKALGGRQMAHNPRVNVSGNIMHAGDRKDNVVGAGIAVGYDFQTKFKLPVRTELESLARTPLKTENAKIRSDTFTFNTYYDFRNSSPFTPYIGGGIGMSSVDFKIGNLARSDDNISFSWNVGAGINYNILPQLSLDLNARYVDFGKAYFSKDIGGGVLNVKGKLDGAEVLLGLKYTF